MWPLITLNPPTRDPSSSRPNPDGCGMFSTRMFSACTSLASRGIRCTVSLHMVKGTKDDYIKACLHSCNIKEGKKEGIGGACRRYVTVASSPVGPFLFQLYFNVTPPTVVRPASLPLPLQVPGQGLASGVGYWLPEGVSDPAPPSPQCLLGHWFLSSSLPHIFMSDLLLS